MKEKTMKIGIISINKYTKTLNYACPLHSYAFQQYLNQLGYENEIIDYKPAHYGLSYDDKYPINNYLKRNMVRRLYDRTLPELKTKDELNIKKFIELYNIWPGKLKKYYDFFDNFCNMSIIKYNYKNIKDKKMEYDCFICVTDVIWQYYDFDNIGFDDGFTLNFPSAKKSFRVGYSVSRTRSDNWTLEIEEQLKNKIIDYDYISTREETFSKQLEKLLQKEIDVSVDPVFFHDRNFWKQIAVKPEEKNYIFMYCVTERSLDTISLAKKMAKDKNMLLIITSEYISNIDLGDMTDIENKIIYDLSPEEWLGYIANADYVITNSFHCTSFSLIFERQFFVGERNEDKLPLLLNRLSLSDRKIGNSNNKDIDYVTVKKLLTKQIDKSKKNLKNVLNELNKEYNERLQKRTFKIYYNSGKMKYKGSVNYEFVKKENIVNLRKNSYEYRLLGEIVLHTSYKTLPCMFNQKFNKFVGWNLRTRKNKLMYWYCNDFKFHTENDLYYDKGLKKMIFSEEFNINDYNFDRNDFGDILVLEAVWKR